MRIIANGSLWAVVAAAGVTGWDAREPIMVDLAEMQLWLKADGVEVILYRRRLVLLLLLLLLLLPAAACCGGSGSYYYYDCY